VFRKKTAGNRRLSPVFGKKTARSSAYKNKIAEGIALRNKVAGSIFKPMLIIMVAVIVLSSALVLAFAWHDFGQSRTNLFRGTTAKTDVVLHKYEKTPDGDIIARPVANAEFLLLKENPDGTWTQIGGIHITDKSGKITVGKLNSGSYKFVEINPGYGYEYDKDKDGKDITEYPFTITADDAEGAAIVAVEAYNRRLRSGLEIEKTVKTMAGLDLTDEVRTAIFAQRFEFVVTFSDGGTYEYRINDGAKQALQSGGTLHLKHGEKAVFADLPVGLYYEVYETRNDDYILTSTNNTGTIRKDEVSKAGFTNTYGKPDPGKIKITIEKIVEGDAPVDAIFAFRLYVNNDEPVRFTLKAGEKKTFELNSGDVWRVVEDDPFKTGYLQTSSVNGQGTACEPDITITFKNVFIGTVWITVAGEKTWDMKDDPDAAYPDSITVELLANGTVVQSATVRPDKDNKWSYSFRAPKNDNDGNEITYTVREVPVPGFSSVVTGNNIKNTWIPSKPGELENNPVKKTITGNRPATDDTFTFKMEALDGGPMPEGAAGGIKTISIKGAGTGDFGPITFTEAGTYTYRVSEVKGDADCTYDETIYIRTVVVERTDEGKLVLQATYNKPNISTKYEVAEFTNNYPYDEETSVSVSKVWAGGSNSLQPTSVKAQLFKDGSAYGDAVTLDAGNSWKHTWTGLEKGPVWTVDETEVPQGYTKTISGSASSGFVITNTFDKPTDEEVFISGKKTWDHGANPANNRPTSITVSVKDGETTVRSATVTEESNWEWSFKLPKFRADGKTVIQYTVDEADISGYVKKINGHSIHNTYKPGTPPGPEDPGKPDPGKPGKPGGDPKTGDNSNMTIWIALMIIGLAGLLAMIAVVIRQRLQKNRYVPKYESGKRDKE
jgi:pilin isopeptide linkage protein/LPXTG-motif cell wall-anchored protein